MTTIAYRDGIMASDSGCWLGDASHGWARKLAIGPDGTLYGGMGDAAEVRAYLAWVDDGCLDNEPTPRRVGDGQSSFSIMRVRPNGPVELTTSEGFESYPAPYFAAGSGAEVAFGALFMGATAEQAIEAAKEHGPGTFGRVLAVRHP